jgi:hypothetical protein
MLTFLRLFSHHQPGCHCKNSLFPTRESLVSDIPAGDGKIVNFFFIVKAFEHPPPNNGILWWCAGEYAVHILCDNEDIPGSPFMAQILPKEGSNLSVSTIVFRIRIVGSVWDWRIQILPSTSKKDKINYRYDFYCFWLLSDTVSWRLMYSKCINSKK